VLGGYWMIDVKVPGGGDRLGEALPGVRERDHRNSSRYRKMSDFPADVQRAAAGFTELQGSSDVTDVNLCAGRLGQDWVRATAATGASDLCGRSCKSSSHELAQGTTPRRARLSSRQSERGVAAAALGLIAEKGPAGSPSLTRAFGRRQPGGAVPSFPRPRRAAFKHRAARLRAVRGSADPGWDDGRPDTVTAFERVGKAYLAFARAEPAFYSAMFDQGFPST